MALPSVTLFEPIVDEVPDIGTLTGLDLTFSKYPAHPQMNLGFNHWIHKVKEKTEMLEKPENAKRKEVVNPYEHRVIDYENDMQSTTRKFFNFKGEQGIVSRAFYKLWELLMMFGSLDHTKAIKTIHIAEAPGAFVQAVMLYREMYFEKASAKDIHIASSIDAPQSNAADGGGEYVPTFDRRVTASKKVFIWKHKNSDLMDPVVLNKLVSEHEGTADLVTADGGFNWLDENYQEQEAIPLIYAEILAAMRVQAKGGDFILKIFDSYTDATLQLIAILKMYYKKVYLTKPLTSRFSNSERYLMCIGFEGLGKQEISSMMKIHSAIFENKSDYIVDLFRECDFTDEFIKFMQKTSTKTSSMQMRLINETVNYIKAGNYFGEEYRGFLERQRKASDLWISTFYPIGDKSFNVTRKRMAELVGTK